MSSVSSTNSTTTSSIYGNRNVLSGLASGLDTETMIENAVSGYQTKITELEAQRTKYEWKQEAYRDIISDMVNFNQKYTSYTSSTNLLSNSFFNNATTVTSNGTNKACVSATGRSSSDIQVASVAQLATAASTSVTAGGSLISETASGSFDLNDSMSLSKLDGTLTLGYGGKTIILSFGESDVFETTRDENGNVISTAAEKMAQAINEKLADETISYSSGTQETASSVIKAVASSDGTITFSTVKSTDGNSVWIDSASGDLKSELGMSTGSGVKSFKLDLSSDDKYVDKSTTKLDYLAENGFSVTLDGTETTIKLTDAQVKAIKAETDSSEAAQAFIDALQANIDEEFGEIENSDGSTSSKLTVSNVATDGTVQLSFEAVDGSSYKVSSTAGSSIGIDSSLSNYVDTGRTLGDILGDGFDLSQYKAKDTKGNWLKDSDGNQLYELEIGGQTFNVSENTTLKSLMSDINSDEDCKVKINYSQTTNKITFTAKDTGEAGNSSLKTNDLANEIFGTSSADELSNGKDAKFTVVIDGEAKNLTRSSNTVDVDGLSVTLKATFNEEIADLDSTDTDTIKSKVAALNSDDLVSFKVSADADTIVEAIQSMVNDYNTMASAIKTAYSTLPLEKSDGSSYEPLSDDDMADMSDSAIERYEEKAKTGLLFGDSDLSSCYSGLLNAISSTTASSKIYAQIGLTTSYSDGTTTLTLNETKLRAALESDPDSVRDAFTGTTGIMQSLSTVVERYAGTTGATKGVLIEKAGSTLAPTSIYSNTWQSAIDDLDDEIDDWQDKLSDKIDYYTTQFTNLETLISEMNSQSSMLSSLSGGY